MLVNKNILYFTVMLALLIFVGFYQSWNVSLSILNMCLISAVMALGVNIQWGYAGLFNVGIMGFAALGGLAAVLISMPPVEGAWDAGGWGIISGLTLGILSLFFAVLTYKKLEKGYIRTISILLICLVGFFVSKYVLTPSKVAVESINPAASGYLGGFGLPIILSWPVGGIFAGLAAWIIGKITLGLRSDYLAIATLGISEIIISILKYEDWMTRGVKNVIGMPRPVPFEINLQNTEWFTELTIYLNLDIITFSTIFVKLCYACLFLSTLLILLWLSETALKSPWGRMMRAIRDNEVSANAMGKNITKKHLQVFILGSVVVGISGAMLTTLDGQLTPTAYQPLRFTFLIWIMVIIGGSGNNWGSVLGGFIIWFFWVESEPMGLFLMNLITSGMAEDNNLKLHLIESAAHMRLMTMGLILLLVLRFSPRGLLPEKS